MTDDYKGIPVVVDPIQDSEGNPIADSAAGGRKERIFLSKRLNLITL
ncbi:MAG: hypothetical protein KKD69_00130 [Euryarchaeota archaeon]|nr:hypothetical protein [Euryarchaeota archaeon]MCG2728059.1 hypothetical protein [Candidatus Methanoperedenaceae archaeon]